MWASCGHKIWNILVHTRTHSLNQNIMAHLRHDHQIRKLKKTLFHDIQTLTAPLRSENSVLQTWLELKTWWSLKARNSCWCDSKPYALDFSQALLFGNLLQVPKDMNEHLLLQKIVLCLSLDKWIFARNFTLTPIDVLPESVFVLNILKTVNLPSQTFCCYQKNDVGTKRFFLLSKRKKQRSTISKLKWTASDNLWG